jgi:hypothetical protein
VVAVKKRKREEFEGKKAEGEVIRGITTRMRAR